VSRRWPWVFGGDESRLELDQSVPDDWILDRGPSVAFEPLREHHETVEGPAR